MVAPQLQPRRCLDTPPETFSNENEMKLRPIGWMKSIFLNKRGTPRQGLLTNSTGTIVLDRRAVDPDALTGLEGFSHVWILFIFTRDQGNERIREDWVNGGKRSFPARVAPPLLHGKRVGLFSTRTPHRPNPIGLTLAKIDSVKGNEIHVSGIDICDDTPIIDLKPYIPKADCPPPAHEVRFPSWIDDNDARYEVGFEIEPNEALDPSLKARIIEVLSLDVRGRREGRGETTPARSEVFSTIIGGVRVEFSYSGDKSLVVRRLHELIPSLSAS